MASQPVYARVADHDALQRLDERRAGGSAWCRRERVRPVDVELKPATTLPIKSTRMAKAMERPAEVTHAASERRPREHPNVCRAVLRVVGVVGPTNRVTRARQFVPYAENAATTFSSCQQS